MSIRKNILVCPLDWGIGHATRCVPIIQKLIDNNMRVIIGADRQPLAFLQQEFPAMDFIVFPGLQIAYPHHGSMGRKIFSSMPYILKSIHKEHMLLKQLINKYHIQAVISDNRFGLWSKQVYSVYMTHQIQIQAKRLRCLNEPALYRAHKFFIDKYDECWIPDFPGNENLSGELSHVKTQGPKIHFVGPLSRFNSIDKQDHASPPAYQVVAMISGPEPQRGLFQDLIINQLKNLKKKSLVLAGIPGQDFSTSIGKNITLKSHLNTQTLAKTISNAEVVICRPGYSTLMDLSVFGKKALLVPTPGQTEQEYLAKYHASKKNYYCQNQNNLDLKKALSALNDYQGFSIGYHSHFLDTRINELVNRMDAL